ncbi:hypothetical protein GCM10010260_61160 [Streptomyces filipinensis]|uniref:Uncharacterized protein n=1 Tax=Streptomyces filipinensis TaxID=66887 RepID=A0A918ME95_9ACTN|nr:hypothetical protein GCM10010260_61160 [Streptomyces filipinensis]
MSALPFGGKDTELTISAIGPVPGFAFGGYGCRRRDGWAAPGQVPAGPGGRGVSWRAHPCAARVTALR